MISVKVLSTSLSFPPFNVNAYHIKTKRHRILFDSTLRDQKNIEIIIDEVKKSGGIDAIILSHGHLDHAGGASAISKEFDVPIYVAFEENERISSGLELRMDRRINKILKVLDFFGFDRVSTEKEREKLSFYKSLMEPIDVFFNINSFKDDEIEIVRLPGHTWGSTGLFFKEGRLLFAGDAVLSEGVSAFFDVERLENTLEEYVNSLEKIENLKPLRIYQGHSGTIDNPEDVLIKHKKYINQTSKKIMDMIKSGYTVKDVKERLFSKNYNILIALSEIVYALEKENIPVLEELKEIMKG